MLHPVNRTLYITGFYGFYDYVYAADYYFEGEHHHFWELAYCLSGTVGISADEKVYLLHPGDLVIYRPFVHHKLWSVGDACCHIMTISFEAEGTALDRIGGAYSCDASLQSDWNVLYSRLCAVNAPKKITGYLHYLDNRPEEYQQIANLCENNLLSLVHRGLPLGFNQSKNASNYERVVRYMKEHLSNSLTVDEISSGCGLSASSVKKLFRHYNSMGIHEYFLHLKMQESIRLLEQGKTVSETADLVGFINQSYFSTTFKRIVGCSPNSYRKTP